MFVQPGTLISGEERMNLQPVSTVPSRYWLYSYRWEPASRLSENQREGLSNSLQRLPPFISLMPFQPIPGPTQEVCPIVAPRPVDTGVEVSSFSVTR